MPLRTLENLFNQKAVRKNVSEITAAGIESTRLIISSIHEKLSKCDDETEFFDKIASFKQDYSASADILQQLEKIENGKIELIMQMHFKQFSENENPINLYVIAMAFKDKYQKYPLLIQEYERLLNKNFKKIQTFFDQYSKFTDEILLVKKFVDYIHGPHKALELTYANMSSIEYILANFTDKMKHWFKNCKGINLLLAVALQDENFAVIEAALTLPKHILKYLFNTESDEDLDVNITRTFTMTYYNALMGMVNPSFGAPRSKVAKMSVSASIFELVLKCKTLTLKLLLSIINADLQYASHPSNFNELISRIMFCGEIYIISPEVCEKRNAIFDGLFSSGINLELDNRMLFTFLGYDSICDSPHNSGYFSKLPYLDTSIRDMYKNLVAKFKINYLAKKTSNEVNLNCWSPLMCVILINNLNNETKNLFHFMLEDIKQAAIEELEGIIASMLNELEKDVYPLSKAFTLSGSLKAFNDTLIAYTWPVKEQVWQENNDTLSLSTNLLGATETISITNDLSNNECELPLSADYIIANKLKTESKKNAAETKRIRNDAEFILHFALPIVYHMKFATLLGFTFIAKNILTTEVQQLVYEYLGCFD